MALGEEGPPKRTVTLAEPEATVELELPDEAFEERLRKGPSARDFALTYVAVRPYFMEF